MISRPDVVVVGSGGSGAPLAARLSEDPERRVLLLEAGPAPVGARDYPPELLDPATVQGAMPGHPANWSYLGHLTAQLPYTIARGRILGGSTALNGAYFVRARPADFDAWAEIAGPEWSYDAMLPVLRRLETDRDYGDDDGHGSSGPMVVVRPPQNSILAAAFTSAARERGFPLEIDKNRPGAAGVGPVPANVHRPPGVSGAVRWNTGLAYIDPARERPNLEVRGGVRVLRVLIRAGRAVGVETTAGQIEAGEVVLCAGAIATPHLLLVSGIGPQADLAALGIDVVADLPVGVAFSDHPDIAVGWRARGPVVSSRERVAFPTALNLSSQRVPSAQSPPNEPSEPATATDLEILLAVKPLGYLLTGAAHPMGVGVRAVLRHPVRTLRALFGVSARRMAQQISHRDDMQLIVALQQPVGRGRITITSADPLTPPRIDYNYLQEEADRSRMRLGIRTAVELLRTTAFASVFDGLTELGDAELDDDAELDAWMLGHLGTAIHMCGSAPMGAVVDSHGRVHGVPGLRVADTSILPWVPSRGPAATSVAIGERIADFMRADG
ncbi:GMC family oxidoreductase N-terminal domain-containing protein [Microbacterium sp.]|uniref:GMC family oxidoreductase n=1 Tax=Microbacterium sp. TaxID=51671 RepID=UPI0025D0BFFE|nr:GMC family oxidoreductase N-terminal domain-containing protein [Microbacterium sp.]